MLKPPRTEFFLQRTIKLSMLLRVLCKVVLHVGDIIGEGLSKILFNLLIFALNCSLAVELGMQTTDITRGFTNCVQKLE